jgi:hypothetical protein
MRDAELIDRFAELVLDVEDPLRVAREILEFVVAVARGRSAALFRPDGDRLWPIVASAAVDQFALYAAEAAWGSCRAALERGDVVSAEGRAALDELGLRAKPPEVESLAMLPVRGTGGGVAALVYVDSTESIEDEGRLERLAKIERIVGRAISAVADCSALTRPRVGQDTSPTAGSPSRPGLS